MEFEKITGRVAAKAKKKGRKELETQLTEKEEELKKLKSNMRFTLIKELQTEAETYFNEARRTKKLLDQYVTKTKRGPRSAADEEEREEETRRLREEVKALRRENLYLRHEREADQKGNHLIAQLRSKLAETQDLLSAVDIQGPPPPHQGGGRKVLNRPSSAARGSRPPPTMDSPERIDAGSARSSSSRLDGRANGHSYAPDLEEAGTKITFNGSSSSQDLRGNSHGNEDEHLNFGLGDSDAPPAQPTASTPLSGSRIPSFGADDYGDEFS